MKKIFLVLILSAASVSVFSQKEELLKAFSKYNIDTAILHLNARKNAIQYAYDIKNVTVTEDNQKINIGKHDPNMPDGQQWQLISVNEKQPSNKEKEQFKKSFDPNAPVTRPNEESYKVVKDEGSELVISYTADTASLTDDNKFLKGFVTTLYINTKTGRLEKSETISPGPFKIKIFNADQMNSNATYLYIDTDKLYVPLKEEILLDLKILGRTTETIITNEFSNYKK